MKKTTKFAAIALASALVLSGTVATSANAADCTTKTTVEMLGTIKPEIKKEFLNAVKAYNASQTCYTVKSIAGDRKLTFLQNVLPKYAAKNAPTIMYTLQEIPDMASKVMDWTGTDLVKLVPTKLLAAATIGGKIVGVPSTAEAFGLLYNKKVLNAAGVDPKSVNSRTELEAAFKAISDKTTADPIRFSGIWWSLGAHVTNVYFANAADTHEGRLKVLDGLAAGTKKLSSDPVFQDWLATFELMKKYNSVKKPNITGTGDIEYKAALADLAKGRVGFWFMGNWAEPDLIKAKAGTDFGIMPMPISTNASDEGNSSISVGVPGYFMIDKTQSTEAERAGAVDFLTWLYTSDKGQHFVADSAAKGGMGFIPVYKEFKVAPNTYMAKEIASYVAADKTLEWMNTYYPAGGQEKYGASGQKLIAGKITGAQYAKEIEKAWKGSVKTWRGAKK